MYKPIALLVAAGTLALAAPSPASAAVTNHIVETGSIEMKHAAGTITGTFEEAIALRPTVKLSLRIARSTTGPNCVLSRVTLTYVGGTDKEYSQSHCKGDSASAVLQFTYPNHEATLLSYSVALMSTEYRSATTGIVLANKTWVMGPSSDSAGSVERLDRDMITATGSTGTVFQGFTDYSIQQHNTTVPIADGVNLIFPNYWLSSRVSGSLSGSGNYAVVTWTYTDGSTSTFTSSPLPTGVTSMNLDVRSPLQKAVWSVKVSVLAQSGRMLVERGSTPTVKFGDHLTP
jgi:hypothetical protein